MPNLACALGDIGTDTDCNDKGGLLTVFWTECQNIDWDAMALAANFDTTTNSVLNWVMNGTATWGELTFERKLGRLDAEYTEENGYYEVNLLNLTFVGKNATRSQTIAAAVSCCCVVAQIFDNNGLARVIGYEFISGAWNTPLKFAKITRHLDTTGGFGDLDDKSRDEFDITGEQLCAPVYSDVDLATMRTL